MPAQQHLDFRLLACITVKKLSSIVLSLQFAVIDLLEQPEETNTLQDSSDFK